MWSALATLALAWSLGDIAPALGSRVLELPVIVVPPPAPENFDLRDVRADLARVTPEEREDPRSIFRIRRHLGAAGGYDQGIVHGSVGLYITVAELGRWNLGVTSPLVGLSRYHRVDRLTRATYTKTEMTVLVSLVSVHYRGGYLDSLKKNWYVSFEQMFDPQANINGSQVGISFSGR